MLAPYTNIHCWLPSRIYGPFFCLKHTSPEEVNISHIFFEIASSLHVSICKYLVNYYQFKCMPGFLYHCLKYLSPPISTQRKNRLLKFYVSVSILGKSTKKVPFFFLTIVQSGLFFFFLKETYLCTWWELRLSREFKTTLSPEVMLFSRDDERPEN